jgi:hypothetical protein
LKLWHCNISSSVEFYRFRIVSLQAGNGYGQMYV